MKKLLAILLAALMLTSVVACSPEAEGSDVNALNPKGNELDKYFEIATGTFEYEYIDSLTVRVIGYTGKDAKHEISIPAVMNDKKVVSIGKGAFDNLSNLTGVTIPASVTEIEDLAFASCKDLVKVSLPASVEKMGTGVFGWCVALETVTFTNVENAKLTAISDSTFQGCTALKSINIPASVTEIGFGAFANCASLNDVTLPAKLVKIGQQAFWGCTSLTKIEMPATLTSCELGAFALCNSLTEVKFADTAGWNVDVSDSAACVTALVKNYNTALVKNAK